MNNTYNDLFFDDAKSKSNYQKRIRVVIQNLNLDFANKIVKRDHCREIIDSKNISRISKDVILIIKDKFINHIQHLMKRIKDQELLETFNSMIVSNLFLEQSIL